MGAWDDRILGMDVVEDFLDELNELEDEEEVLAAVKDACVLAQSADASEDEYTIGLAAATLAAIWAGAPFSAGQIADTYPVIRNLIGYGTEEISETALDVLESAETEEDLDVFLEALS
ncbi:hypothetical protein CATYP_02745 [Corynebacterium atypicum]|uniref:DUF4259 domain-containing protein n=1 Tax=Corynebacterium atypicum TaxID=191610 RepID=A0ABM5QLZ8_9CORY|nr:hypothetical protein [Corynebacterium atypicum]AIG63779.1 hypothetical protein CATYP_02745 [Corynebacterium atypicum]